METIKDRLDHTSKTCISAFARWDSNKKDPETRGALSDAIHELRKVVSRLEIEMAISERDESQRKPLPIPAHRNAPHHKNKSSENSPEGSSETIAGDHTEPQQRRPQLARRRPSPTETHSPSSEQES